MSEIPDIVRYSLSGLVPSGRGLLVMLKAYMDSGAKREAGNVVTVAAALFNPIQYDFFVHEWQQILDGWGASAFHATDFYPGARQFRRKNSDGTLNADLVKRFDHDSRLIPEIIARRVHKLFVVSFREDEYLRVAPEGWRKQFGGVYRVGAQALTGGIGHWAKKTNHDGDIAYFYETGDRDEASVRDAYQKVFDDPVQRAHTRMARTPIGMPKGKLRGLEVADFLAWHWNKFYVSTEELTKSIHARKDIQRLMDLLALRNDKIEVAPLVGNALEEFLLSQGCERVVSSRHSS